MLILGSNPGDGLESAGQIFFRVLPSVAGDFRHQLVYAISGFLSSRNIDVRYATAVLTRSWKKSSDSADIFEPFDSKRNRFARKSSGIPPAGMEWSEFPKDLTAELSAPLENHSNDVQNDVVHQLFNFDYEMIPSDQQSIIPSLTPSRLFSEDDNQNRHLRDYLPERDFNIPHDLILPTYSIPLVNPIPRVLASKSMFNFHPSRQRSNGRLVGPTNKT